MSNPKKPNLVGTGVQKGLLKTPVYDAEFFEQETKRRDRGLGHSYQDCKREGCSIRVRYYPWMDRP